MEGIKMPNYDSVVNTVKEQVIIKTGKKGIFRRIAERIGLVQKEVQECKGKTLSEMAEMTSKKDVAEISKSAKHYCLDTSIHDTFIKRIPTGDFKRTPANIEQTKVVKNIVGNDMESGVCDGVLLNGTFRTDVARAFANETELPLYTISPNDFIDKKMGKELVGEAEYYIRQVVSQLEKKFENTGERSVLLFRDLDKMCPKDAQSVYDTGKRNQILMTLLEAKPKCIIPIMTARSKEGLDPVVLRKLRVVE